LFLIARDRLISLEILPEFSVWSWVKELIILSERPEDYFICFQDKSAEKSPGKFDRRRHYFQHLFVF